MASPIFGPPPASGKKALSQKAVFDRYINAHRGLKPYAQGIYRNALAYGIDPLYFASLINTESGGNPNAVSSKGAIGLGQIMPMHIGELVPWAPGQRVTLADLKNPGFNLKWSAAYFSSTLVAAGGNYQQAYSGPHGYNQGGPTIFQDVPKGYVPTTTAQSPTDSAGKSIETANAKNKLTASWAVLTKNGVVKFVQGTTPPKGTIKDATGAFLSQADYTSVANSLDSIYLAYTGQRVSAKAVAQYVRAPVSDYQITQRLSDPTRNPRFYKSPIWLTHAPDYQSVYQGIYGNDADVNTKEARQLITYGVVHNLSQSGFQEVLRKQPNYNTSEEYKGAAAQMQGIYQQIYGTPDALGKAHIDKAVRSGWNGDQWAQFLRSQPEYTASGEFQKNVYSLMNQLGFNKPNGAPMTTGGTDFGPMAPTPTPNPDATGSAPA